MYKLSFTRPLSRLCFLLITTAVAVPMWLCFLSSRLSVLGKTTSQRFENESTIYNLCVVWDCIAKLKYHFNVIRQYLVKVFGHAHSAHKPCYTKEYIVNLVRVSQNQNDRVTSQKHFADVSILVHRSGLLRSLSCLRRLRPHFLNVLQNQVAVSIESFHSCQ